MCYLGDFLQALTFGHILEFALEVWRALIPVGFSASLNTLRVVCLLV